MPQRKLTSLNNNKRKILTEFGYKSISAYRKDNPTFKSDETAYKYLLGEYNDVIEMLNEQERQQKEAQKAKERRQRQDQKAKERADAKQKKKDEIKYVKSNVKVVANSLTGLWKGLRPFAGKDVVVEYIYKGKVLRSRQYSIDARYSNWWKNSGIKLHFQVESPDIMIWNQYEGGKLYIYDATTGITGKKITQLFREGITNCLLTPIKEWVLNKLTTAESKRTMQRYASLERKVNEFLIEYENGVPENCVYNICDTLQIDIDITTPFAETNFIEARSTKKALTKFKYINTRLDHIDMNKIVNDGNVIELESQAEMDALQEKLDTDKQYYTFNRGFYGINQITTLNAKYTLKSDYMEEVNKFMTENQLNACKLDDIHDEEISKFVRNGVHFNETIDFNTSIISKGLNTNIRHADIVKAYTQYKACRFYEGFLGKITDFRETDKIMGVGMYLITDLIFTDNLFKQYNDKMKMYMNHNIYTSAELKMLTEYGVSYKIKAGCWGVKPIDFDFTEEMINKKDIQTIVIDGKKHESKIPYYSKWTGTCFSSNLTKSFWVKGDAEMANIIQSNCEGAVRRYENGEIQIQYKKQYAYHLSHITGFITAYMRMNMIEQLMQMDVKNIVRVCCDGVYYMGDYSLMSIFEPKTKMTFKNMPCDEYCSGLNGYYNIEFNKPRKDNHIELHLGEGGSGKTHYNLTDKGFVRPIFVAPSWKLARAKQKELGVRCSVWARVVSTDPNRQTNIKESGNVLILDEVSMMSEVDKEFIFKTYADMKIIMCGDLGFQLPCFDKEPMSATGFNEIITHTQDHRCKCPKLKAIKVHLREMIEAGEPLDIINAWCVKTFKQHNRLLTIKQLSETYDVEDMILTGTKNMREYYTQLFAGKFYDGEGDERIIVEKYYITSNNRIHSTGEIVVGVKPHKTDCVVRHAFTTHSIQGETATHKLFIESRKMFDSRMFYTAISRAKTLDQIYLIEPSETELVDIVLYEKSVVVSECELEEAEEDFEENIKKGEKAYDDMVARWNKQKKERRSM